MYTKNIHLESNILVIFRNKIILRNFMLNQMTKDQVIKHRIIFISSKLGVQSFMKNGVRSSLIPVLINYFQDRQISVKWHGCHSIPRKINKGGPQGATLGISEYLSQSNNSTNFVDQEDCFKFMDNFFGDCKPPYNWNKFF